MTEQIPRIQQKLCFPLTLLHRYSVPLLMIILLYEQGCGSVFIFPDPDPEYDVGDQYGSGSGSNTDPGL
jgi:hypothetical protein